VFYGDSDKEHLHIDNSCNSIFKGRLYCAWRCNGQTRLSYSTNDGISWSPSMQLSITNHEATGVNITTDNSGCVYVVCSIRINFDYWNQLQFRKSTDGGISWNPPLNNPPTTINLGYTGGSGAGIGPSMSVSMDVNPILYLVYSGNTESSNYNDIFLKKSTDRGDTWSGETIVNQNPLGWQTYPWISCDPITGNLACIYYDTRNNAQYNTYLSVSTNYGSNWCDMKISNLSADHGDQRNDYIGVEFNKGIIYPIWSDRRNDGSIRAYTYPYEVISKNLIVQGPLYGNRLFQSAKTISTDNVIINSSADITFRTVESIMLLPGFSTSDNCNFKAELFHCDGYNEPLNITQINTPDSKKTESKNNLFEYSLSQNYPNPFNPITTFKYSLKKDSWVTIRIFNILGQEVKKLVDRFEQAGISSVDWNGTNDYGNPVSSGIYFYKLIAHEISLSSTGNFIDQKKMVIIR
jgi:hypothetical protein